MKVYKYILILLLLTIPSFSQAATVAEARAGYILLQVEANGEAWYVFPNSQTRFYLGRPTDAFAVMKKLALGAKHNYIVNTTTFPARLSGQILFDVESKGEAYYIYPKNLEKYYLGRPADAFRIMRELSLGVTNSDLGTITIGDINKPIVPLVTGKVLHDVPFAAQAPFGDWADQRQEDGCEEASAIMAIRWSKGRSLSNQEALDEIIDSSDYTQEKYGEYRDISTEDTINWIIKDHFNFNKAIRKTNVSKQSIINELKNGGVVIAPMNGQLLKNPNFTPPGPVHHMLVIIGYDAQKNVFITNDPGTRRGARYEYNEDLLFEALRDYPTGWHLDTSDIEKNIIVVWK
jgi:hypothetical protein